jgi:hypothetical protein
VIFSGQKNEQDLENNPKAKGCLLSLKVYDIPPEVPNAMELSTH